MDFTKEVAHRKTELLTRRFIGMWRHRNSAGNRRPHPAQTGVPDRLQRQVSGLLLLSEPSLGVLVQRSEQHNLVVSGGLVCPFLAGCGEDIPLVNMEDRMLDRFADHQS